MDDDVNALRAPFLGPVYHELREYEIVPSSDSLATGDHSASSPYPSENVEEYLENYREINCLTAEGAKALLGILDYRKGNIETALHLFDGIDVAAVTPMMELTIAWGVEEHERMDVAVTPKMKLLSIACAWRVENRKRRFPSDAALAMNMRAVNLVSEAIFLKSKSLQVLGRYREAAQSCKVILDIIESALPQGLPENFGTDFGWQKTLKKAVQLLPELWKLAGFPNEAISSYRHALFHHWSLDEVTTARMEKEFAIFLLYSGCDANPSELHYQTEGFFVPRSNIEEAVLLLMILLTQFALKKIEWDPSVMDHLSFALSLSGELRALAHQFNELLPEILWDRKERYYILALCYYGVGKDIVALDLLRRLLSGRENPNSMPGLLLASKICGENPGCAQEGEEFARRALCRLQDECDQMGSVVNCLLGVSLSAEARSVVSDSERTVKESEALRTFETAEKTMKERDPKVLFHLSLENAEQRRLNSALYYAKKFLKLEANSNIKGWILLARILSAKQRYKDAKAIINTGLDKTANWDQGDLLRTKAKLHFAQRQKQIAVETYTVTLGVLEAQNKSFGVGKKFLKCGGKDDRSLEMETWLDLANLYTSFALWNKAEFCLSKSKAIRNDSASHCHATGLLYKAKGQLKKALEEFENGLLVERTHVPSLVSSADVRRKLGYDSYVVRSFLKEALRLDPKNAVAWYNLGILHRQEEGQSSEVAAECFKTAHRLKESEPAEPFR